MGLIGLLCYDVVGMKMVYYFMDDFFEIIKLVVYNLDQNQVLMEFYLDIVCVIDDQMQIYMYGNVNVICVFYKGCEQMYLVLEYLLLLFDDEIVKIDKLVVMIMGIMCLNGVGMVVNNVIQVVQLFGNVCGYYEFILKKC